MKKTLWFAMLCLPLLWAMQQVPLKKMKIGEGISMLMPESFRPMTDEEVVAEYTVYRRPLAMYCDNGQPAHLGINVSASQWQNSDMGMLRNFYRATLLDLYTDIDFAQDTLIVRDGSQFVVFEFTSMVKASEREQAVVETEPIRRYNYIQYTVQQGKVMIFNFNCPARIRSAWAPVAEAMMASVQVKE
jgi:hypothetical protein